MIVKLFLFSLVRMKDPQLGECSGYFPIDFYEFWIKNAIFAELHNMMF